MESLLFTREDLKKLIVPLIIEQALALSIGLFDTLMVSSCGEAAVSGVSLVDSISTLLIQILSALATGGAVVCSQYIGKKMPERAKLSAGGSGGGYVVRRRASPGGPLPIAAPAAGRIAVG
mgnify:CR=1 FL=1